MDKKGSIYLIIFIYVGIAIKETLITLQVGYGCLQNK